MFVKYQTLPTLPWFFKLADEVLELLVMRFLDVFSHHWHWQDFPYDSKFNEYLVPLEGAPSGNPHNNPFFGVIAHLGGRPFGYIVNSKNPEGYFIGFKHPGTNYFRRCSIKLNQPVMLLTGPDKGCSVFALDKDDNPLKIELLSDLIHKKYKPKKVRIL